MRMHLIHAKERCFALRFIAATLGQTQPDLARDPPALEMHPTHWNKYATRAQVNMA
jgi:hypothetical protein